MHPDLQARIRIVQSPANRWVKALRAAVRRPPGLGERGGLLALEGPVLIGEALKTGGVPQAVFLRGQEALPALVSRLGPQTELLRLPAQLFDSTVETESPQGVARSCSS